MFMAAIQTVVWLSEFHLAHCCALRVCLSSIERKSGFAVCDNGPYFILTANISPVTSLCVGCKSQDFTGQKEMAVIKLKQRGVRKVRLLTSPCTRSRASVIPFRKAKAFGLANFLFLQLPANFGIFQYEVLCFLFYTFRDRVYRGCMLLSALPCCISTFLYTYSFQFTSQYTHFSACWPWAASLVQMWSSREAHQ